MHIVSAEDIVFVGDVHLGRRPTGIDDALGLLGLDARELAPAAALAGLVDALLRDARPRAVVFAGDLVDQERDRFEAFAVLEREVGRLSAAGIPVFAVAGNHDGVVLPRLVERVEGVRLIGRGGEWERVELPGDGRPVDLLGWSFPGAHHRACPLDEPSFAAVHEALRSDALHLGVLHADLDAAGSRYAPVSRGRLLAAGLHGWFLGHVHQPGELSEARPVGYLGSLAGLDGGETGPRGAWRVRPTAGGVTCEQLATGPVRFEDVDVELEEDDVVDADAVHERVRRALRAAIADRRIDEVAGLRLVVARVRLVGRLPERQAPRELARQCEKDDLAFPDLEPPVVVRRVEDRTRPAVDLDALARESTPIGHVARQIVALREGAADGLLAKAAGVLERVRVDGFDVDEEIPPPAPPGEMLDRAAWRLLDTLLGQRGERGERGA